MRPNVFANGLSPIDPLQQESSHRIFFDLKRTERRANFDQMGDCMTLIVPKCHYSFEEVCNTHYKEYCESEPSKKTCKTKFETICVDEFGRNCNESINSSSVIAREKRCYKRHKKMCRPELRGNNKGILHPGKHSCKNIPMKICKRRRRSRTDVKVDNCRSAKQKRCHQIPKTQCKEIISRNKCEKLPIRECHQVPKQVCFNYKKTCCHHNCGHPISAN